MAAIKENKKNQRIVSYQFSCCLAVWGEMQTESSFAGTAHGCRRDKRPESWADRR